MKEGSAMKEIVRVGRCDHPAADQLWHDDRGAFAEREQEQRAQ